MLTDDMTRLCGEILAMRRMRGSLMSELQHGAKGRKQAVAELCAHIGSARVAMARRTRNERVAFLNSLRRSVGAQSAGCEKRLGWRPQSLGRKKRLATYRRDPSSQPAGAVGLMAPALSAGTCPCGLARGGLLLG